MKPVHMLRIVCSALVVVVMMASGAQAGYWKFIGVQGVANQVTPDGGGERSFYKKYSNILPLQSGQKHGAV